MWQHKFQIHFSVDRALLNYSAIGSLKFRPTEINFRSFVANEDVRPWRTRRTKPSVHGRPQERPSSPRASPLSLVLPRNLLPVAILCRSSTHSYSLTCSQNSSQHVLIPSPDSQASHHGVSPTLLTHHDARMSLITVELCSRCLGTYLVLANGLPLLGNFVEGFEFM